jgi:predicted ATP-grasp superfamily ATP-dependent carboligase
VQSKSPTVLVTDAARGSAVAIIRSLGHAGWRVIAGDSDAASPGFRSRHVAETFVYPPPTTAPEQFFQAIRDFLTRQHVDLVIPVTDAAILPLSRHRHELPAECRLAVPEPEQLEAVLDKLKTVEIAKRLGIPTPRTHVVSIRDGAPNIQNLGWPVVLKPRFSRVFRPQGSIDAFEVSYARDSEELASRLRAQVGDVDVLVQEYCPGVGHGVGILMHEGRPLAAFQHRRLHEVPVTGGPSALRESVPLDPLMYDYSVRLMSSIRWTGLAMVEFKVGASGPRLMEVNGRVWGSLPLAVLSGVDFPRLLADLYRNGPPSPTAPPQTTYKLGVRARNLALDLIWIATVLRGQRTVPYLPYPSRGEAFGGMVSLMDPRIPVDTFAPDDPGPWFAELPVIARRLTRKIGRN